MPRRGRAARRVRPVKRVSVLLCSLPPWMLAGEVHKFLEWCASGEVDRRTAWFAAFKNVVTAPETASCSCSDAEADDFGMILRHR